MQEPGAPVLVEPSFPSEALESGRRVLKSGEDRLETRVIFKKESRTLSVIETSIES
jgi:hypothetical protein